MISSNKNSEKQKHMEHITLTTGETRISPRSEVADEIIALVQRDLLPLAAFAIPGVREGWTVQLSRETTASMFSIYYYGTPILTCGLAMDAFGADVIWPKLKSLHSRSYGCLEGCLNKIPRGWPLEPSQPRSVPWLGVVLLPTAAIVPPEDMCWLGDFERCVAWAIIDETPHAIGMSCKDS